MSNRLYGDLYNKLLESGHLKPESPSWPGNTAALVMIKRFFEKNGIDPSKDRRVYFGIRWLREWPKRDESRIFLECGHDHPWYYFAICKLVFVISWTVRTKNRPAKVLEFKKK